METVLDMYVGFSEFHCSIPPTVRLEVHALHIQALGPAPSASLHRLQQDLVTSTEPLPQGRNEREFWRDGSLSVDLDAGEAVRQPWLHHLDSAGEVDYAGTLAKKTESVFGFGESSSYYHYVSALTREAGGRLGLTLLVVSAAIVLCPYMVITAL